MHFRIVIYLNSFYKSIRFEFHQSSVFVIYIKIKVQNLIAENKLIHHYKTY